MSDWDSSGEPRVPCSVVLIVTGVVILLAVGAIYFLRPSSGLVEGLPTLVPRLVIATPRPTVPVTVTPPLVLLPESPDVEDVPLAFSLPSEATEADAPRSRGPVIAGQPLRLVIPALEIDAPVWEVGMEEVRLGEDVYYRWAVPGAYAAGWHNSSAPLGRPGNTVLNGHHNVYGEIFRDLVNLEIGSEIILYDQERSYTYRVTEQHVLLERGQPLEVRAANAHWIEPTDDERLTIITCWPYTDNSHRVVVVAYPVR